MSNIEIEKLNNLPVVSIRSRNEKPFYGLLDTFRRRGVTAHTFSVVPIVVDRVRHDNLKGFDAVYALTGAISVHDDFVIEDLPGFQGLKGLAITCAVSAEAERYYPLQFLISAISDDEVALLTIFLFAESNEAQKMALEHLTPEQRLRIATTLDSDRGRDRKTVFRELISGKGFSFDVVYRAFEEIIFGRREESFEDQQSEILDVLTGLDYERTKELLQTTLKENGHDQIRIRAFNRLTKRNYTRFRSEVAILAQTIAESSKTPIELRKHIATHYKREDQSEWAIALLSRSEFQT